jgi:urease accessory protein
MALIAKMALQTGLRAGRTVLQKSYCSPPLKIADVTEDRRGKELHVMLMSSSPGILDGDVYQQQIDVGAGCHLELTTQSYQRLFQMKRGATQMVEVRLAPESSFFYLPHPIVPHEQSIFSCKNTIHVAAGCSLVWGEIISCGRKMNGEVFKFSSYRSITEIFMGGRLVVKENLLLEPGKVQLSSVGQLEGYTHQASLICVAEKMDVAAVASMLLNDLKEQPEIAFGVSALPVNGLIIRLLGHQAEPLFAWIKKAAGILKVAVEPVPQT